MEKQVQQVASVTNHYEFSKKAILSLKVIFDSDVVCHSVDEDLQVEAMGGSFTVPGTSSFVPCKTYESSLERPLL